jgi:rubrerythrin
MGDETLGWLIEKAVDWECAARDFYVSLTDSFASEPEISAFWRGMSEQESQHAAAYRSIERSIEGCRLSEAIGPEELDYARSVDALWVEVGTQRIETLDEAYELAHVLEGSEVNTVFRMVVLSRMSNAERRDALAAELDDHLDRLTEFGRLYDKPHRCAVAIDHGGSEGAR